MGSSRSDGDEGHYGRSQQIVSRKELEGERAGRALANYGKKTIQKNQKNYRDWQSEGEHSRIEKRPQKLIKSRWIFPVLKTIEGTSGWINHPQSDKSCFGNDWLAHMTNLRCRKIDYLLSNLTLCVLSHCGVTNGVISSRQPPLDSVVELLKHWRAIVEPDSSHSRLPLPVWSRGLNVFKFEKGKRHRNLLRAHIDRQEEMGIVPSL